MGHPRRLKSKIPRPRKPWDKARIEEEKKLMQEYGLRRKRELWRLRDILRRFRARAREIAASYNEKEFRDLMTRLTNLNLVPDGAGIETILGLTIEDLLERRLQTVVYKKGLARTIKQARQFIVHGHVFIGDRRVVYPGYLVRKGEENDIRVSNKVAQYSKEVSQDGKE